MQAIPDQAASEWRIDAGRGSGFGSSPSGSGGASGSCTGKGGGGIGYGGSCGVLIFNRT